MAIEPKDRLFRVDPLSGEITDTYITSHYPTHTAALAESRRILNFRRAELQNELALIDTALSGN